MSKIQEIALFKAVQLLAGNTDATKSLADLARWMGISVEEADQTDLGTAQVLSMGGKVEIGSGDYLRSILEIIGYDSWNEQEDRPAYKQAREDYLHAYPLQTLSLENFNFPKQPDELGDRDTSRLLSSLLNDAEKVFQTNGVLSADNLLGLLEKYTSFVPVSTECPDVALYDHAKMTAAFASLTGRSDNPEKPYLLVGADISGIQDFIYSIASRSAAKNLKGRSFYLQLLSDGVLLTLLDQLELQRCHVVYASGGGFFVLAPNTRQTYSKLEAFHELFSNSLFKEHGTELYLVLGTEPFGKEDICGAKKDLGMIWGNLLHQLSRKKGQRFLKDLTEDVTDQQGMPIRGYSRLFEPSEHGAQRTRDYITNEEFGNRAHEAILAKTENPKLVHYLQDETKEQPILPSTYKQVQLGKHLRETQYILATRIKRGESELPDGVLGVEISEDLPIAHYLITDRYLAHSRLDEFLLPDDLLLTAINDSSYPIDPNGKKLDQLIQKFGFYGGNKYPTWEEGDLDEDDQEISPHEVGLPKDYSALAGSGDFRKLGVVRMDVDNLGQLFVDGLEPSALSFARYSVLSRSLDYFFQGFLNEIWKNGYRDTCQILYSGGDDLFIIGNWQDVLKMSMEIQDRFQAWSAQNPKLTISGGIVITASKFPVIQAAKNAKWVEERAKEHISFRLSDQSGLKKNAFTLLGHPLHWESEFAKVKQLKDELYFWIDRGSFDRSLLTRIRRFHFLHSIVEDEMAKPIDKQDPSKMTPRWKWIVAYSLGRMLQTLKDRKEEKDFIERLKLQVFTDAWQKDNDIRSKYSFLQLLAVAGRWAELELRTNSRKSDQI